MKLPLAIHCAIKLLNQGGWVVYHERGWPVYQSREGNGSQGDLTYLVPDMLKETVSIGYETPERRTASYGFAFLEEWADLTKINGVWTLRVGAFDGQPQG
jgi:hypothetical protein